RIKDLDTITLYINRGKQEEWYEYILNSNPRRVIFNPGAENQELVMLLKEKNIQTVEECTLVMLSVGRY
ncbi:MAG: CoA-binding protein, partial [Flavobacteriales bacterium]|nr:CoA-binding protein [Flavobacteriales bacterium]